MSIIALLLWRAVAIPKTKRLGLSFLRWMRHLEAPTHSLTNNKEPAENVHCRMHFNQRKVELCHDRNIRPSLRACFPSIAEHHLPFLLVLSFSRTRCELDVNQDNRLLTNSNERTITRQLGHGNGREDLVVACSHVMSRVYSFLRRLRLRPWVPE